MFRRNNQLVYLIKWQLPWNYFYWNKHPEMFCKKRVLKNFSKFTRKHLCQSLFFNKVAGLSLRCFPVNFENLLRAAFFIEHLRWLLLNKLEKNTNQHYSLNFTSIPKSYSSSNNESAASSWLWLCFWRKYLPILKTFAITSFYRNPLLILWTLLTIYNRAVSFTFSVENIFLKIVKNL